ncbi:MAG: MFS transporter [Alphaproteobacteria bacterium]|nr:MFS transporter [Alphaproteobacteria bacterium]
MGRRALFSWCVYDWANSAFPTVISTFVFSAYFTQAVAETPTIGTAQWSWALTASGLVIAVLSPVFGAIADASGRQKPWLALFTVIAAIACALLWWVAPSPEYVLYAMVVFAIANAAFEFGTVFYNAMLPEITPASHIGRVSGWGWGLGYAGGLACLVVVLLGFVQAETPLFGLDKEAAEHVRVAGPVSALWFALFSLPIFLFTPDLGVRPIGFADSVRQGLATLLHSLANIRKYANIVRYLFARMIYTDGLNTLFAFGGIFAAGSFGMPIEEVILFGITMNVTAGLGAAGFAWIDDWVGAKRTILISIASLTVIGTTMLLIESKTWFWVLALLLGTFFGPAQAASRSLMARLAPPALRTEMFGLYALSGKATAFVGPFVLGWVTLALDSQRAGMATIMVFFVVGALLLLTVREDAA